MKALENYIQESILDSDFDLKENDVKFAAAANIIKRIPKLKRTGTINELVRTIGKPMKSGKARREVAKDEYYKDGCIILIVRDPIENAIYQPRHLLLYRFNGKSLYPDVLKIVFKNDWETPGQVSYFEKVSTITWCNNSQYWIFGGNNDLFKDLIKTCTAKNWLN